MRKTPMGTCQQPCSVVRDPSGTPFVVSKNNTCKRSFGGITIKIHYKIKYLKVPTYEGVVEQMEQEIEVIGARYGVLTRMMGVCIVLETLVEMGLACGVVACLRRLVLLGNGRIGFALQLAAPVQEVATRMKPITHPTRVLARRMPARHQATSPIRSHADAVEAVMTEVVTMGLPDLGRALRSQLYVYDGRTLRLNRDQDGLMACKDLIAQIHNPFGA